jgi:hypothetical protein
MTNDSTISLQLSIEELLFVLSTLEIHTVPGLGTHPTDGLTEEQIQLVRSSGFNSLRAHGLVQEQHVQGNKRLALDSVLVALIGTCAAARHVLLITQQPANSLPKACYFHFAPHLTVMHKTETPGVHQLLGTVDPDVTLSQIMQQLHLDHQLAPAEQSISITEDTLDEITFAVRENKVTEGIRILQERGIPGSVAYEFVNSVSTIVANTMVVLLEISQSDDVSPVALESFALIESPRGFWHFTAIASDTQNARLDIKPVAASNVVTQITEMIQRVKSESEDLADKESK